jgi:hypothetical protein
MTQNMSAAKPTFQCALTHWPDNACTTDKPEDKNEFVADLEFLEVGQRHIEQDCRGDDQHDVRKGR